MGTFRTCPDSRSGMARAAPRRSTHAWAPCSRESAAPAPRSIGVKSMLATSLKRVTSMGIRSGSDLTTGPRVRLICLLNCTVQSSGRLRMSSFSAASQFTPNSGPLSGRMGPISLPSSCVHRFGWPRKLAQFQCLAGIGLATAAGLRGRRTIRVIYRAQHKEVAPAFLADTWAARGSGRCRSIAAL